MSKEEFKEGDTVRCIPGWYTGEETNNFEIIHKRGEYYSEFHPRYDIQNYVTGEYLEGCYLHNGYWELLNQNKDEQ